MSKLCFTTMGFFPFCEEMTGEQKMSEKKFFS